MQRAPASSSKALSLEQRQFAAEQHNLIYAYLNEKGLYHEEYYDIAAFGYLQAVKRYLTGIPTSRTTGLIFPHRLLSAQVKGFIWMCILLADSMTPG